METSQRNIIQNNSNGTSNQSVEERKRLFLLKQILLKEDRLELEELKRMINDPALLSKKVSPIIEDHFEFLKKNFPEEFRFAVEGIIERKLETSQDRLLDVLYPKIGLMIKRYIAHEMQQLKENIEEMMNKAVNQGPIGKIKTAFSGKKPADISNAMFKGVAEANIEEIYLIEHHSGILLGSASKQETIDLEVIAGMLTAIKSFVEDAFKRGDEQLELIRYGNFTILLQNFHSYYLAAVVSGVVSDKEKTKLEEVLMNFAQSELNFDLRKTDGSSNYLIKKKLEKCFFEPQVEIEAV